MSEIVCSSTEHSPTPSFGLSPDERSHKRRRNRQSPTRRKSNRNDESFGISLSHIMPETDLSSFQTSEPDDNMSCINLNTHRGFNDENLPPTNESFHARLNQGSDQSPNRIFSLSDPSDWSSTNKAHKAAINERNNKAISVHGRNRRDSTPIPIRNSNVKAEKLNRSAEMATSQQVSQSRKINIDPSRNEIKLKALEIRSFVNREKCSKQFKNQHRIALNTIIHFDDNHENHGKPFPKITIKKLKEAYSIMETLSASMQEKY